MDKLWNIFVFACLLKWDKELVWILEWANHKGHIIFPRAMNSTKCFPHSYSAKLTATQSKHDKLTGNVWCFCWLQPIRHQPMIMLDEVCNCGLQITLEIRWNIQGYGNRLIDPFLPPEVVFFCHFKSTNVQTVFQNCLIPDHRDDLV